MAKRTKTGWVKLIKKACEQAGTYQPYFDETIKTLAGILVMRDDAEEAYLLSGSQTTLLNSAGNWVKNPKLTTYLDCNKQALAYWQELGLTPKGLKNINEQAVKPKEKVTFASLFDNLGA